LSDCSKFFSDNFYLFNSSDFISDLNNFLYNLRNLNNLFNCIVDNNNFLSNDFDWFNNFIGDCQWFIKINILLFYFQDLNNSLYFNNFWYFNNFFNYFLYVSWNFNNSFNNSFCWNYLISIDNYLFGLSDNVVNWFLNCNNLSILYNFLDNSLYLNYSWNLNYSINYLLDNSWNFNNFFTGWRNFNDLLDNIIDYFDNFDWNMNNLFNLLNSWNLDNLFNNSFDCNDLRDLNYFLNNFLNNFFNFNKFWNDSEDFKNIINTDDSHNLLIYHSNNSLIDL
jgi:hypothetical protein